MKRTVPSGRVSAPVRFAVTVNYELPFGRSLTGAMGQVLANWQVNALVAWQTGLPFNITNAATRTTSAPTSRRLRESRPRSR